MGANSSRARVEPAFPSSSPSSSSSSTSSRSSLSSPVLLPTLPTFGPLPLSGDAQVDDDVVTPLPSAFAAPEGARYSRSTRSMVGAHTRSLRRPGSRSGLAQSPLGSTPSLLADDMVSAEAASPSTSSASSDVDSASIAPSTMSKMSRRSRRWSAAWAAGATSSDPSSYFPAPPMEVSTSQPKTEAAATPAVKPAAVSSKGKGRALAE